MALLNSLFAGVSGLRNHQSMMDVIGNNIANVNTIGFKGSRVTFSDTFNQFVKAGTNPSDGTGGTNSFQVGLGMKVNSIDRNWNQGTFERTGITTDLALQGQGLFVLKSNGQQLYSRAGAYIFDADGKLVNPQNGAVVQGKVANGLGDIPAGTTLQDIVIDKNLRLPAVKTTEAKWGGNLQSSSTTIRTDTVELVGNLKRESPAAAQTYPGAAFNAADPTTYNVSSIYNKDGQEYQLWSYYTEATAVAPATGAWTYHYEIRDETGAALTTPITGSYLLAFDATTGVCTTNQETITDSTEKLDYKLNFSSLSNLVADNNVISRIDKGETPEPVLGSVTIFDSLGNPHILSLEFSHIDNNRWSWKSSIPTTSGTLGSNAYGEMIFNANGTIQSVWQAGSQVTSTPPVPKITFTPSSGAEAQIMDLDFGTGTSGVTQTNLSSQIAALSQNGSASAALSNLNIDQYGKIIGNSRTLAQIMVATFANLNGLVSVGDNMYNVAANSGDPRIDTPGENSVTTIQSGALEQSNVDLSEEFTRMIVSQRGFQANARVVTTADNLLQEITNLIR